MRNFFSSGDNISVSEKLGKIFRSQQELSKKELEHENFQEVT